MSCRIFSYCSLKFHIFLACGKALKMVFGAGGGGGDSQNEGRAKGQMDMSKQQQANYIYQQQQQTKQQQLQQFSAPAGPTDGYSTQTYQAQGYSSIYQQPPPGSFQQQPASTFNWLMPQQ